MILTVILFLVLLSVLVLAHEWGHYFTARKFKMKVEEFGLGYPPRIFAWKNRKTGVLWSINLIPIGGFVKIEGENSEDSNGDADSFCKRPIWQRFTVLFAGVFMNMVVAAVFFTVALGMGTAAIVEGYKGTATIEDRAFQVTQVLPDSPADLSGLMMGDSVISINDQVFESGEDLRTYLMSLDADSIVEFEVGRSSELIEITVVPSYVAEIDDIGLGVAVYETGIVHYPWYSLPWRGVETTTWYTKQICAGFYGMAKNLVSGNGLGVEVSGPVGIAVMTGEAAQMGFVYILQFAAILSINLAILNILPIPALDGGRIMFLIIEGIIRKPVSPKVEAVVHNVGFLLLMLLILFVTYKDVLGLFK
ncbi:RIP metalloprotease RseP [Candidatus Uhrbacteria bacterium]|jgi:regulator of sigma E protease|nr:RIP metalloprotease RseP [Candidatus Uhrbacteria bacterium]MBT7717513.1 RIP metalloprotease RseP [Candidatus Uhrbacteria bacterium]